MAKHNKYSSVINAEIDLHGLTALHAISELEDFIKEAEIKSYKKVRVITGKGLHSPDGRAVIKEAVMSFLKNHGLSFTHAKLNEGGEGALIVSL